LYNFSYTLNWQESRKVKKLKISALDTVIIKKVDEFKDVWHIYCSILFPHLENI